MSIDGKSPYGVYEIQNRFIWIANEIKHSCGSALIPHRPYDKKEACKITLIKRACKDEYNPINTS